MVPRPHSLMLLLAVAVLACCPAQARSLAEIRAEGVVRCGGVTRPGLAWPRAGVWEGIEPDTCRAVAAALFGPAARIRFRSLGIPGQPRPTDGSDDLAFLTPAEAIGRASLGASLPGPAVFTLVQAVAVADDLPVDALAQLGRTLICLEPGTPAERGLLAYGQARGLDFQTFAFQEEEERQDAFDGGRCDAVAGEAVMLAASPGRRPVRLLPEPVAVAPVLAFTSGDDASWGTVVAWTIHTLVAGSPAALPLDLQALGLAADWQKMALAAAGSAADMLARDVTGPLGLPAGLDAPWDRGGARVPAVTQ